MIMNHRIKSAFYTLMLICIYPSTTVYCQEQLEIGLTHSCFYATMDYPEELYSFNQDSSVESLKNDILAAAKISENFILLSANVSSIAALEDKTNRYVLYSRRNFNTLPKIDKTLLLAHAIGHHAYQHHFNPDFKTDEDIEADEFMGFTLSLLGYSVEAILNSAARLPLLDSAFELRKVSIKAGYTRGEVLLKNSQHAAFNEKEINEVLKNMPVFALPPPIPSAEYNLEGYFTHCKTLGQVDKSLAEALYNTGYFSKKYYYTEGGYVVVTKMEQFNKDGSSKQGNGRWSVKPVRDEGFSITNYLMSFLTPEPGFFRVIAFVVSGNYYGDNSGKLSNKTDVMEWLEHGYTSLPSVIGDKAFSNKVQIHALVYEFVMKESTKKFNFSKPSELDGMTHLRMAKILENIKK